MSELDRFERLLDQYQDAISRALGTTGRDRMMHAADAHDYRHQLIDMFKAVMDDLEAHERSMVYGHIGL